MLREDLERQSDELLTAIRAAKGDVKERLEDELAEVRYQIIQTYRRPSHSPSLEEHAAVVALRSLIE